MRDGGGEWMAGKITPDFEAGCSANFFRGGAVGFGLCPGLRISLRIDLRFSLGFVRRRFR